MSFQAYLDTIKKKTGKSPEQFRKLADKKGLLLPNAKAGDVLSWLKADFGLGHGHAMASTQRSNGLLSRSSPSCSRLNNTSPAAEPPGRSRIDSC